MAIVRLVCCTAPAEGACGIAKLGVAARPLAASGSCGRAWCAPTVRSPAAGHCAGPWGEPSAQRCTVELQPFSSAAHPGGGAVLLARGPESHVGGGGVMCSADAQAATFHSGLECWVLQLIMGQASHPPSRRVFGAPQLARDGVFSPLPSRPSSIHYPLLRQPLVDVRPCIDLQSGS